MLSIKDKSKIPKFLNQNKLKKKTEIAAFLKISPHIFSTVKRCETMQKMPWNVVCWQDCSKFCQ